MIRFLFILLTVFCISRVFAQCNSNEYKIEGVVHCVGDCGTPDLGIVVLNQRNDIISEEIPVDSFDPPYDFLGCVQKSDVEPISLKVIFNRPTDFAVTPQTNLVFHGGAKKIRIKKVDDIYFEMLSKAKLEFESSNFDKSIAILETFKDYGLEISPSQEYRISKLLADSYLKNGESSSASEIMNNFIAKGYNLRNGQQFESLMFLSSIYYLSEEYELQYEVLKQVDNKINMNQILPSRKTDYYKDKFNNILSRGNFVTFRHLPALELANEIEEGKSDVSLEEWSAFYKNWTDMTDNPAQHLHGSNSLYHQIVQVQDVFYGDKSGS